MLFNNLKIKGVIKVATSKLRIKSGRIVNFEDRYFQSLSENGKTYFGNSWEVRIVGKKIICHCERRYEDGIHKQHREFYLRDGLIGLSGGHVDERYVYFRDAQFQQRLDKLGITAIKRENPNGEFIGRCENTQNGTASFLVQTDGKMEVIMTDVGEFTDETNNPLEMEWKLQKLVNVSHASWTVLRRHIHTHTESTDAVILYTKRPNLALGAIEFLSKEGNF